MARFRATIRGQRGEASRLGSKGSGLHVTANGWNAGVKVLAHAGGEVDDAFDVYLTSGSNGHGSQEYLGRVLWNAGERSRRWEPARVRG
jgi:hypothetical protein